MPHRPAVTHYFRFSKTEVVLTWQYNQPYLIFEDIGESAVGDAIHHLEEASLAFLVGFPFLTITFEFTIGT
jgi:hypothetical protein